MAVPVANSKGISETGEYFLLEESRYYLHGSTDYNRINILITQKYTQHEFYCHLDFGSQYAQLIARRVREAQSIAELFPWDAPAEKFYPSDQKVSFFPADQSRFMNRTRRTFKNIF